MHVAGKGHWLSHEFLFAIFDYPFRQLNIVQVFTTTAANNERSLKLQRHVGFKPFAIIPRGWDEQTDLIVLTMTKAGCRWLKGRHEQRELASACA
jgi:RimJ/RimL family protein N-acetyltransferase